MQMTFTCATFVSDYVLAPVVCLFLHYVVQRRKCYAHITVQ